jgi:hypothetical protein
MSTHDLASDAGLRSAAETVGSWSTWDQTGQQWIRELGDTILWVRSSDEAQRGTREFQKRLWDDNHVAAVGQGNIAIDRALDAANFRCRVAAMSMAPLPVALEDRFKFLQSLTDVGREWAARIHWQPESLPADPAPDPLVAVLLPPAAGTDSLEQPATPGEILLPELREIVELIQAAAHFERSLIERLHFSLWAQPIRHFAILTGLSGSGKTLLARYSPRRIFPVAGIHWRLWKCLVTPD